MLSHPALFDRGRGRRCDGGGDEPRVVIGGERDGALGEAVASAAGAAEPGRAVGDLKAQRPRAVRLDVQAARADHAVVRAMAQASRAARIYSLWYMNFLYQLLTEKTLPPVG